MLLIAVVLALTVATGSATAGGFGPGPGSGIGTCPNPGAPDDDGDGIPNGQDPDYIAPHDGSGYRWGRGLTSYLVPIIPLVPGGMIYGILGFGGPSGWGPGDGTGNDHLGPEDGTGYGPGPYLRHR
jgi:hypothetical protein